MPKTICSLRGVSRTFQTPSGMSFTAVENIDLELRDEEVTCLLGPSGCGKSTLLRIFAGLLAPTAGEVEWHGQPLRELAPGVSIVFQGFALLPWLTVEENIEVVLAAAGLPAEKIRETSAGVIRLVGLAGFEEAYPRELSGGMKQRVGIARALAVAPELLMMDEPFSQVDALTAESLRAEVLDIWAVPSKPPSAILMVSHDIKEVVFMADRIVILSANPGRVRQIIDNPLPRPRDYRSPAFQKMVDYIHDLITGVELPDAVTEPAPEIFEPLPPASPVEILGLMEYLDSHAGEADVFRIASDLNKEFGLFIHVVKAAELLDFIDTPKRALIFTPLGRKWVQSSAEERQRIWREQLLQLNTVRHVYTMVRGAGSLRSDVVAEEFAIHLPQENPETSLETFISWVRFGNLLAYDTGTDELTLQ
jgi:NitT/TauT family transport system ATP-binding protein